MTPEVFFTPLAEPDLPRIAEWLARPHVSRYWGDPERETALVGGDLADARMEQFVFHVEGRPAGYIQSYDPDDWEGMPFGELPPGTRGIDMFIAEADFLGRGWGGRVLRLYAERLFASGVPAAVIDPEPDNLRALRAYEKAGFRRVGEIPAGAWGPKAMLMRRDAP